MITKQKKSIQLYEVVLMRSVLAALIVFMHSFTCYNGDWEAPEGYIDIFAYKWLQRISFAFTLESFVLISGYLYAFQIITLKRQYCLNKLIKSKLKRLILPSLFFSTLYFVIFIDYQGLFPMIYSIVNGCGHMWFLPMLFWCFIGIWLLEKMRYSEKWVFFLLVLFNLFSFVELPLRLSSTLVYLVYFYTGFMAYKYSEKIKTFINKKNLLFLWINFLLLFVFLRPLRDVLTPTITDTLLIKFAALVGNHICLLLYAFSGSVVFLLTAISYTEQHSLWNGVKIIASYCFGIYLIQQFVLEFLYYKTSLPIMVGPYLLPWIGFLFAIVLSILLSNILLKTRLGKFLIG